MRHSQTVSAKLILIASVVLVGSLSSQTTSPFVGDWKLNTERSKPTTGERLLRISAIPDGFEFRYAGSGLQIRCVADGKEHPYTIRDGKHSSHTASCKILNERKLEIIENHDNGKVITTFLATISADGKTLEEAWSNKSEDGSPLSQDDRDWILDRQ